MAFLGKGGKGSYWVGQKAARGRKSDFPSSETALKAGHLLISGPIFR